MNRYWRIYRTFFSSSLTRELEFKANFIAKLFQNMVWIAFFFAILNVVYRNTNNVAGWTRGDAYVLASTVYLIDAFSTAFFMSLTEIPQQVRQGTLDFVITKPVDSQFWISTRRFNFDQIGTLLAGIALVVAGSAEAHLNPSPVQWAAYLLLVACAIAIYYSFNLSLMTTGIWLVRVDNLWVLSDSVRQIARYPLDIYGAGLQRFLTYGIPLGLIATVPSRQLVRGLEPQMVAVSLIWTAVALFLSRTFWRFAMRHYSSASS